MIMTFVLSQYVVYSEKGTPYVGVTDPARRDTTSLMSDFWLLSPGVLVMSYTVSVCQVCTRIARTRTEKNYG